jgi:3-hydroxy-3-methylglutaryl CoA synthase
MCLDEHRYRGQKIYNGSYFIAIAHYLPHHFQDSRWLLAGYGHCVS